MQSRAIQNGRQPAPVAGVTARFISRQQIRSTNRHRRTIRLAAGLAATVVAGFLAAASSAIATTPNRTDHAPTVVLRPGQSIQAAIDAAAPEAALQRTLERALAENPLSPGMIAAVDRPGLRWRGAVGVIDRATGVPLRPHDSYRIASVGKTFTAVAVLRLFEQGRLGLDEPIARYLPAVYRKALRDDGYQPRRITIRMVLQHTGGLWDFAGSEEYAAAVFLDIHHRWTRLEQLRFAMEHGDPLFPPGDDYAYSDTGYILLGEIIEQVTGLSQAEAYRRLLRFERIGVRHTYLETLEPPPRGTGPRAHQYLGDLDTFDLDASHDLYGGGGQVSTAPDQNRFFRALFAGRLLSRRTLRTMTTATMQSESRGEAYGMGIDRIETAAGVCFGHNGYWGAASLYCPQRQLGVSVTVNAAPPAPSYGLAATLLAAAVGS